MNNEFLELKYNVKKIDDAIRELHVLENRAAACSNTKFRMLDSDGDPKIALINAYESVTVCAASVALFIGSTIGILNYAKNRMLQEDDTLKKKMKNQISEFQE